MPRHEPKSGWPQPQLIKLILLSGDSRRLRSAKLLRLGTVGLSLESVGARRPFAIVFDYQNEPSGVQPQSQPHFACVSMFNHIIERFLQREKKVIAQFRI